MKRWIAAALTAALCLAAWLPALAQEMLIEVYVAEGAMAREAAQRLVDLAQEAYPQARWSAVFEEDAGLSLRELVLLDRAPQVAICAPGEALAWAKEGLLAPLDGRVEDLALMQTEVVEACVRGETLFMAPLKASHRRVAVNAAMLDALGLAYMLDQRAHPALMPSEIYQIAEEASLAGYPALELWPPQEDTAAAVEAFVQSLYGGRLSAQAGSCGADSPMMIAALSWVRDMVRSGLIGIAKDRQSALEHFLNGETLMFIDWTNEEQTRYAHEMMLGGATLREITYPSADCRSVRSFELAGAAVFTGHDAGAMSLALQGVALWMNDERAQGILGERGVWRDDAIWLPCLSAQASGATLRSLFAGAVSGVLTGERAPQEALGLLESVYTAVAGG